MMACVSREARLLTEVKLVYALNKLVNAPRMPHTGIYVLPTEKPRDLILFMVRCLNMA